MNIIFTPDKVMVPYRYGLRTSTTSVTFDIPSEYWFGSVIEPDTVRVRGYRLCNRSDVTEQCVANYID